MAYTVRWLPRTRARLDEALDKLRQIVTIEAAFRRNAEPSIDEVQAATTACLRTVYDRISERNLTLRQASSHIGLRRSALYNLYREGHLVPFPATLDRILRWAEIPPQETAAYKQAFHMLRRWQERRKHPRRRGQWVQCEVPGCAERRWVKDEDVHKGRPGDGWAHNTAHARLLEFRRGFRQDSLGSLLYEALLASGSPSSLADGLGMSLAGLRKLCRDHREKYGQRTSKTIHLPIGPLETERGDGFLQHLATILKKPVADLRRYVPGSGTDNIRTSVRRTLARMPKGSPERFKISRRTVRTFRQKGIVPTPKAHAASAATMRQRWADPVWRATQEKKIQFAARTLRGQVHRQLGITFREHSTVSRHDVERILTRLAQDKGHRTVETIDQIAHIAWVYLSTRHQKRSDKQEGRPPKGERWIRLVSQRISATILGSAHSKVGSSNSKFFTQHDREVLGLSPGQPGRPRATL